MILLEASPESKNNFGTHFKLSVRNQANYFVTISYSDL